jgi:hypothetical protein
MGAKDKDELARLIQSGAYKVDVDEVAAAMLRRNPSMFEAREPLDGPAVPAEEDEPAPDSDVA